MWVASVLHPFRSYGTRRAWHAARERHKREGRSRITSCDAWAWACAPLRCARSARRAVMAGHSCLASTSTHCTPRSPGTLRCCPRATRPYKTTELSDPPHTRQGYTGGLPCHRWIRTRVRVKRYGRDLYLSAPSLIEARFLQAQTR